MGAGGDRVVNPVCVARAPGATCAHCPASFRPYCAGAVELRNTLNSTFGVELPPTVTLDYPSIAALAGYLASTSAAALAAGSASASAEADDDAWSDSYSESLSSSVALAEAPCLPLVSIAAVSSLLPGSSGVALIPDDAPSVVPLERWDVDGFAQVSPNALEARFGSFVSGAQLFDAAAFSISRPEALYMDPQQRLLLEHAAEALAGRTAAPGTGAALAAERTGVMVGIGPTGYPSQGKDLLPMSLYSATGAAISVAAGR